MFLVVSASVQLPPPQLEAALNRIAALKAPLIAHASQPDIQSSLPRFINHSAQKCHYFTVPFPFYIYSILKVEVLYITSAFKIYFGLGRRKQCFSPCCQYQFWVLFLFRSVLVVLGIVSDSQVPSQPQTSQTQTGETSNSDKDTMTEKSKESSTAS